MVRAILEGRKTQTRRILKNALPIGTKWHQVYDGELLYRIVDSKTVLTHCKCPYGKVGDILWVKETFSEEGFIGNFIYKADDCCLLTDRDKWKPSIFMPKVACRMWLKITDLKVEKLNDIKSHDAMWEGMIENGEPFVGRYKTLWEKINGQNSWSKNPFVWVITFEKVECPKGFC